MRPINRHTLLRAALLFAAALSSPGNAWISLDERDRPCPFFAYAEVVHPPKDWWTDSPIDIPKISEPSGKPNAFPSTSPGRIPLYRGAGDDAVEFHPRESDLATLSNRQLQHDVNLAIHARRLAARRWGEIPDSIFVNDVLPYSNVDESLDDWRSEFTRRFRRRALEFDTPGEAALWLNRAVFDELQVRYHPSFRPKPNQSPFESEYFGYASCSGLSILLINACRACGIPARFVGTPLWTSPTGNTHPGNHSWVEIWDGRQWRFVGATESKELDRCWFMKNASQPGMLGEAHRIFARVWDEDWVGPNGEAPPHFPMVWSPLDRSLPAIDVTRSYTHRTSATLIFEGLPDGAELESVTIFRTDVNRSRVVGHEIVVRDPVERSTDAVNHLDLILARSIGDVYSRPQIRLRPLAIVAAGSVEHNVGQWILAGGGSEYEARARLSDGAVRVARFKVAGAGAETLLVRFD